MQSCWARGLDGCAVTRRRAGVGVRALASLRTHRVVDTVPLCHIHDAGLAPAGMLPRCHPGKGLSNLTAPSPQTWDPAPELRHP